MTRASASRPAPALARHVLRFDGPHCAADPEHLRVAVSRWLDDDPGQVVPLSPHGAAHKAWGAWWRPRPDGGELEVGVASQALSTRFLQRAAADGRIVFGDERLTLRDHDPAPRSTIEWAAVAATDSPGSSVTARFLTPTTLRRGSSTTPWLDPASLAISLSARWNALAPAGVPPAYLAPAERAALWVSAVSGTTRVLRLAGQRVVPGFVGDVTYRGDDEEVLRRFTALLGMAQYLGAGARTTYGFGRMRLE